MNCPKCNFENVDNASYCINCGARMDGKVTCPQCGEFIEKDECQCKDCGFTITKDIKQSNKFNDVISRILKVYGKVATYVSLAIFICALIFPFLKIINPTSDNAFDGYGIYYLSKYIEEWVSHLNSVSPNVPYGFIINSISTFFVVLVVLGNIVINIIIGVTGLKKISKAINEKHFDVFLHKELIAIFLANIVSTNLMNAILGSTTSSLMKSFLSITGFTLFGYGLLMLLKSFNKQRILYFAMNCLLLLSFGLIGTYLNTLFLPLINATTSGGVTVSFNAINLFSNLLMYLKAYPENNYYIASLVLSAYMVVIVTSLIVAFIMIANQLFNQNLKIDENKTKSPYYALSLTSIILSTILLIVSLVTYLLLDYVFAEKISLSGGVFAIFVTTVFNLSVAIFSLVISRKYRKIDKAISQLY